MQKPEIVAGSFVEIDTVQIADEYTNKLRLGWVRAYLWPMQVFSRTTEHVVLQDWEGRIVHLGSTADPSFHIGHVKLVAACVAGSR